MTLHLTLGLWRGTYIMRLSAVTDLPLPDSPTMPRVSLALSSNETPSTAFTTPSGVENWVLRSWTSRRGPGKASYLPEPWIESVADRIAEKVSGKDGEEDQYTGPDHQPT